MKKLLLAAVMMIAAPAFGASPTATLSAQIVPAPSGPPVPAAAQAAGFTTVAANWDFSQPLYANSANWYDCPTGTNLSLPWHGDGAGQSTVSCTDFNQANDGGVNVLRGHYSASNTVNTVVIMSTASSITGGAAIDFPNMYLEATFRIEGSYGGPANTGGPNAWWTWQRTTANPGPTEMDMTELLYASGGFGDAGVNQHNPGFSSPAPFYESFGTNNLPAGWSPTTYHTYGLLLTGDGATARYACDFVDNRLQGCVNTNEVPAQMSIRQFIISDMENKNPGQPQDTFMDTKYARVWSCSSWAGTMCNGSSLVTSTQDGQTLQYWH